MSRFDIAILVILALSIAFIFIGIWVLDYQLKTLRQATQKRNQSREKIVITIRIKDNCNVKNLTRGKIYPVIDMPKINLVLILDDNGQYYELDYRDDFFTFSQGEQE